MNTPKGSFQQLIGLAVPKTSHGTTKLVGQLAGSHEKQAVEWEKRLKSINDVYGTQMADSTNRGRPVQMGPILPRP